MSEFTPPAVDTPPPPVNPGKTIGCGFLMGLCTVIPGGDSGTIALIMGIYQRLVTAISRIDAVFLMLLGKGQLKKALQRIDALFLVFMGIGVVVGVGSMGKLMHYLMEHHFTLMLPIFFGMIGASCWMVAKLVERWGGLEFGLLFGGIALAIVILQMPGLKTPPDDLWYIVICGFIGICALILPGISGSFLLIILGKYHDLTGVIDRATKLDLTSNDFGILVAFAIGCGLGLVSCSKVLKWMLEHHGSATMAGLCGIKIGFLYKIWPFQKDLTPEITEFKHKTMEPILAPAIDGQFWFAILLVIASAAFVIWLEHYATKKAQAVIHDDQPSAA
ncbi:DUF368 domain-containing protein [Planctomicrobium sp. SH668]|uniref:DUF368 domain-containing protein n=1 Tax=Planctomicrobium sp. SH668 TaxID=3448126 RepID=UPI003F5C628D